MICSFRERATEVIEIISCMAYHKGSSPMTKACLQDRRLPLCYCQLVMDVMNCMQADSQSLSSFAGDAAPTKAYVLRSLLPEAMRTKFVASASADVSPAFVLLVLSIINLAGGTITEGMLCFTRRTSLSNPYVFPDLIIGEL